MHAIVIVHKFQRMALLTAQNQEASGSSGLASSASNREESEGPAVANTNNVSKYLLRVRRETNVDIVHAKIHGLPKMKPEQGTNLDGDSS